MIRTLLPKILIGLVVIACAAGLAGYAIAEAEPQASDFELKEPTLLPGSPFYFFKNWGHSIQSFFTFNSQKKLELESKFSNEKLLEIKKLVESNKDAKVISKAVDAYNKELEKVKKGSDKVIDSTDPATNKFLEKLGNQQTLHQALLQKLETQVKPEVYDKIKSARERHLKKFAAVMEKVAGKECPQLAPPSPDFCKDGVITSQDPDANGCSQAPKCLPCEARMTCEPGYELRNINAKEDNGCLVKACVLIPSPPPVVCATIYDPVCGKDNNTYSNSCFAEAAKVEVDYKGECKTGNSPTLLKMFACETDSDCVCGVKKGTKECAFGNRKFIDTTFQCPDYCSGIAGQFELSCGASGYCKQNNKPSSIQ